MCADQCVALAFLQATLEGVFEVMQDSADSVGVSIADTNQGIHGILPLIYYVQPPYNVCERCFKKSLIVFVFNPG